MNRCSIQFKVFSHLVAFFALSFVVLYATSANATIVTLDDFSTAQTMQYSGGGVQGPTTTQVSGPGSSIVGGTRKMTIQGNVSSSPVQQLTSNTYANPIIGNPSYPNPGFWNYETGSMTAGKSTLTYDANGAGLGSLLAGLQTIQIHMIVYNAATAGPGKLRLSITDNSNNPVNFDTLLSVSDYAGTFYTIPVTGQGINFNNIKSLSLGYDSQGYDGPDFIVDSFSAVTQTNVPEPSTLALLGAAGVVGLCMQARRRKQLSE
jgi:hypothetical protein